MDKDTERQAKIRKHVDYMNAEGFVPDGMKLHFFRDEEELVDALRRNEVPGVQWTEECEKMWQAEQQLIRELTGENSIDEDPWL